MRALNWAPDTVSECFLGLGILEIHDYNKKSENGLVAGNARELRLPGARISLGHPSQA